MTTVQIITIIVGAFSAFCGAFVSYFTTSKKISEKVEEITRKVTKEELKENAGEIKENAKEYVNESINYEKQRTDAQIQKLRFDIIVYLLKCDLDSYETIGDCGIQQQETIHELYGEYKALGGVNGLTHRVENVDNFMAKKREATLSKEADT